MPWGRIATITGSTSARRGFEYHRAGLSGRSICLRAVFLITGPNLLWLGIDTLDKPELPMPLS